MLKKINSKLIGLW